MSHVKLRPASWNRFVTRGFRIKPELLGASIDFPFQDCQVTIHLPREASWPFEDGDNAQAVIGSWREEKGEKIPTGIAVASVDVIVQLVEDVMIPEEVLHVPLNAYGLIAEEEQKYLNALAYKYGNIAEEAFDLWIRILRWKNDSSIVGRPEIRGSASGWSTELFDPSSQKRFWAGESILTVPSFITVDKSAWDEIQQTLQSGCEPPVFYELLFDAVEHIRIGDLQRAIVDMSVACEAYMRKLVIQQLPPSLGKNLKEYIERAYISRILDSFLPEALNVEERKTLNRIKSDLKNLFQSRNEVVHSGRRDSLTLEECNRYLEATRNLIAIRP